MEHNHFDRSDHLNKFKEAKYYSAFIEQYICSLFDTVYGW